MLSSNRWYVVFGAILLTIWFVYLSGAHSPLHYLQSKPTSHYTGSNQLENGKDLADLPLYTSAYEAPDDAVSEGTEVDVNLPVEANPEIDGMTAPGVAGFEQENAAGAGTVAMPAGDPHVHEVGSTNIESKPVAEDGIEQVAAAAESQIAHRHSTLSELCSHTKWTAGLWLHCHSYAGSNKTAAAGGLNNARNRIQTCIRLAIDAGAGLIIPPIMTQRGSGAPAAFSEDAVCADEYFNIEDLQSGLAAECPQLELRMCGDTTGIQRQVDTSIRHYSDPLYELGSFNAFIGAAVGTAQINLLTISAAQPVAVSFGDSFIAWNYTSSHELDIRKELFSILNFPSKLLEISASILASPLLAARFAAVHLRGEGDWPPQFGNLNEQITAFTAELQNFRTETGINTVYVSTGSRDAIGRLRANLEPMNFTVHDKFSILAGQPELLAQIESMEFDKQAIVEYDVLVGADYFLGVMMSTLSLLVAYARSVEPYFLVEEDGREVLTEAAKEDFFETYLLPGSERVEGKKRIWKDVPKLMGSADSKLLVVNAGDKGLAIFDSFP